MTVTIPDLWPAEAVKVDVLTPFTILRVQATNLHQKTQNILRAEVIKTAGESDNVTLSLDLIAPALNNYRHRLLKAQFKKHNIYPVSVIADGLKVEKKVKQSVSPLIADMVRGLGMPTVQELTIDTHTKTAYSEREFLGILQEVLQSPETIALLQSLIARSNEQEDGSETEDEEDEAAESTEE